MAVSEQCVLVTGAARGIGRATAEAFAARGARLLLNYLGNEAGARETAGDLLKGLNDKRRSDSGSRR